MHLRISDQKMKAMLFLVNSVPLPQKSSTQASEKQVISTMKARNLLFSVLFWTRDRKLV